MSTGTDWHMSVTVAFLMDETETGTCLPFLATSTVA